MNIIKIMIKELFNKLLNILNIHPDSNQKWLLLSMFFSGLLVTYASPAITKEIVSSLPAEWIAFEALFGSISGLLIGILWKGNLRKKAINYFTLFAISESFIGCLLAMFLIFIYYNVWIFAIVSLIYTSFISIFVGKCIMAFKSKLWNEQGREIYDNNISIVSGIVCILGFGLALVAMPSLKIAIFLWGICCIIDDIGWIYVYFKNKNTLIENC